MPIYLFLCPNCFHRFQSDEQSGATCPQCSSEARRDWKSETVTSNYHPTRDLYANDVKRRAGKQGRFY